MNLKRVAMGGLHVVFGLFALLFSGFVALATIDDAFFNALFIGSQGSLSLLATRVGAVLLAIGFVVLGLTYVVATAGWVTKRVSRARIHRASTVGVAAAALMWFGLQVSLLDLDFFNMFAPAFVWAVLVLPLAVGARITRPTQPPATEEGFEERGRPLA